MPDLPREPRADARPPAPRVTAVGDRCWVVRLTLPDLNLDLNLGVVAGRDGVILVDSGPTEPLAAAVLDSVAALQVGPVTHVVNTHAHWDHVLGNAAVRARHPACAVLAHEETAASLRDHVHTFQAGVGEAGSPYAGSAHLADLRSAGILPADTSFSSVHVVDLGDRVVELVHPGRGHTAGDVVVHVPDAAVLFAGDLVEQAAPPSYGEDCWPLEWATALDVVVGTLPPGAVVVPGHGDVVDRDFVQRQRDAVGVVSATIRDLAGQGVRPEDALTAGDWPYPVEQLADAVRRGYEHLPRGARRLPLA
ncbi:MAG: MBL fold metallo-hydrolase [Nocardioides sp.]|nr:MBL fold metallo-hydrolase [Nocardioides sp.]